MKAEREREKEQTNEQENKEKTMTAGELERSSEQHSLSLSLPLLCTPKEKGVGLGWGGVQTQYFDRACWRVQLLRAPLVCGTETLQRAASVGSPASQGQSHSLSLMEGLLWA